MAIRVNGEEIPQAAIEFELSRLIRFYSEHISADQIRKQMDLLKTKAQEQAIGAKLLIAEANRLDIKVSAEDIEAGVRRMTDSAGGEEPFQRLLAKQNIAIAALRKSIEQGRRVDMLIERITQGISDPTEEEIKAHFKEHAQEYAKPDRVQAQHILVNFDPNSEEDRRKAKSRIFAIRKQIEEGAGFSDMAAAYSDCPSGRKTGGSLGWFSRGMMIPEFDNVVFDMEVGTLSDAIESPLGYHVIYKLGQDKGGLISFEEARDKVREFLRHARRGAAVSEYVNDLKKTVVIEQD